MICPTNNNNLTMMMNLIHITSIRVIIVYQMIASYRVIICFGVSLCYLATNNIIMDRPTLVL